MANVQSPGHGNPKTLQKELPSGSSQRQREASLKAAEVPLRHDSLQPSPKLPQEVQGKVTSGSATPKQPALAKLSQVFPEQSSSKGRPSQARGYTFARSASGISPKYGGRPQANLSGNASPETKGSRRPSAVAGKLGASPKFDSSPMRPRSMPKSSGTPTPNESPKPGASRKGSGSPSPGTPRTKSPATSRRTSETDAEASANPPTHDLHDGDDKKGQPGGTTPASITTPGKAPALGHAKPESPGQSRRGSRRGSRSPRWPTPNESEFSSALIKYPNAQAKLRGVHTPQTGPPWAGLRLPVIIAVCSCAILLSVVVLVLMLLLVVNPRKPVSNTTLAPRALPGNHLHKPARR